MTISVMKEGRGVWRSVESVVLEGCVCVESTAKYDIEVEIEAV